MTKLEALNMLLLSSGQLPVQDYNSNHPDAISARNYIERWSQQSQQRGWYFNTFFDLTLDPDLTTGEITLPQGSIRVDIKSHFDQGAVRRGKLWNSRKNTYVWEDTLTADVFVQLDFDDCPVMMQTVIAYQALREWQAFHEGDSLKINEAKETVRTATIMLNREQTRFENNNILTRPQAARYLGRMARRQGGNFNPRWPGGKVV